MNKIQFKLRLFLLALAINLSGVLNAQNFEFSPTDYDFNPAALTVKLMDSTGYSSSLHWVHTYVSLGERNGQASKVRLIHILRQINDTRAVEEFNKFYIPLYGDQEPVNVKIRVIKDGKELFIGTSKDIKEFEETNARYKAIALEQVSEGCLIESVLAVDVNYDFDGAEFLQFGYPCKESMLCMIAPKKVNFKNKIYGSDAAIKDTITDDKRYSYVKLLNVKAAYDEKYAQIDASKIRFEYKLGSVENYDYKALQWADVGTRLYDVIHKEGDKQKSGIKKIIKACGADKLKSNEEKIFAVENYLKTNVLVMNGTESTPWVTKILENKYCNSTDFVRMMALTLEELEINYELVGTCKRDEKFFDKGFSTWGYIQDLLLYFPDQKQYLDPSASTKRFPDIDNLYFGQDAVRVKTEILGGSKNPVTSVKTILPSPIDGNIIKERFNVSFDAAMTESQIKWLKEYHGQGDQGMKAVCHLAQDDDRKKILESVIAGADATNKVENIKVENADITKREEYNAPLIISADVKGSEFLEFAGDKVIFKVGEVIGQQSELYAEKPRQCPMDVGFLHYYDREIRITIPDNYKVSGMEALNIDRSFKDDQGNELFAFVSSYTMEGNVLVIKVREAYDRLTYPVEMYENFSKVINAAADFNKITLLFNKK